MQIRWLTAFVDMPPATFDAGCRFWCGVTGTTPSEPRGDADQFATLLPPDGDAFLRVQRCDDATTPRIHLDLHVMSVPDATDRAMQAGAAVLAEPGHVILASPTGLVFCLVDHHGEDTRPRSVDDPFPNVVDQICIDVPDDRFDEELQFWSDLTGWAVGRGALTEFAWLESPRSLPLRILLQRLGADDGSDTARAHLDLSCGRHVDAVSAAHVELGGRVELEAPHWTTLIDPAGLPYCLTQRNPETGVR